MGKSGLITVTSMYDGREFRASSCRDARGSNRGLGFFLQRITDNEQSDRSQLASMLSNSLLPHHSRPCFPPWNQRKFSA
jgi:hypothetical protein